MANKRLSRAANNKLFKRTSVKTKKLNKSQLYTTPGGTRL